MKKKFQTKDFLATILLLMFVSVIFITTGYSAFQTNLNISGEATVRAQADIRITNVTVSAVSSNAFSTYEKYNVNNITSGADLPNENSTITYTVEVTNFGNVEEAINSITGLPSNLEVKSIGGYTLKDTICDQNNECTLGISKSIPITIGYKEGAYNSSNTHFDIELDLAFKRVFNITYHGIVNHNYPDRILEDDTLEITFVTDIPESVSVSGVG